MRFYSNDPVGYTNVHTFNRYAYANNNPYKYTDPDGRTAASQLMSLFNSVGGQKIKSVTQKVAGATTLKVGFGAGLQVKANNIPLVGSFDAGGSIAVSSVFSADDAVNGIEFSADAGISATDSTGNMTGKAQIGKAEALVRPDQNTVKTKVEGPKLSGSLTAGSGSVDNSSKVKVGAHIGLIKVEVEVDTSKL